MIALFFLCSLSAIAQTPDPEDPAYVNYDEKHLKEPKGFHGMLFFGRDESLYISHLPMFHRPHDFQVIMEVRIPATAKGLYLASLKENGGYFTFAPNGTFVLPQMAVEKFPVKGTLYQGHFERGGKRLMETELELVRTIYYKKLKASDNIPEKEKFLLFGKGNEYFLAHDIGGRPNRDEILPVLSVIPPSLRSEVSEKGHSMVELLIQENKAILKKDRFVLEFPYQEFYRETGDLQ